MTTTTATTVAQIDPETLDAFRQGIPAGPNHDTKQHPVHKSLTSYVPTTDPRVFLTIYTAHYGNPTYAIASQVGAELRLPSGSTMCSPMHTRRLPAVIGVKRRTDKSVREAHAAACAEVARLLAEDPTALDAAVLAHVPYRD